MPSIDSVKKETIFFRKQFFKKFLSKANGLQKILGIKFVTILKELLALISVMLHTCSSVKAQNRRALLERKSNLKSLRREGKSLFKDCSKLVMNMIHLEYKTRKKFYYNQGAARGILKY